MEPTYFLLKVSYNFFIYYMFIIVIMMQFIFCLFSMKLMIMKSK